MCATIKKKKTIEPTEKQKKAFKDIVENGSNKKKAMLKAGYSKNTAVAPTKMTKTKGWEQLVEKYLPDSLLTKKHKQLLEKKEVILRNNIKTGKIEVKKTGEIDAQAVGKGLDLAYKLKNKFAPTQIKFVDDNEDLSDEELEDMLKKKTLDKKS